MIKLKELAQLPLSTLEKFALALARDVDAGDDKAALLETILGAIQRRVSV